MQKETPVPEDSFNGSKAKSLVDLARKHALPSFQYMDNETHRWILQNNPGYKVSSLPGVQASDIAWLDGIVLPSEWFLEPRIIDSLHGLRHLLRTAIFTLYVLAEKGTPEAAAQTKNALVAALVHDIRRRDDKADEGHAERSARWFEKNAAAVALHLGLDITPGDIISIAAAIELHEIPYDTFTLGQQELYRTNTLLVDVLKTADALDRYRLPKLKWWINDEHLRLRPSLSLKQIAFTVVATSEGNFLKQSDSHASVRSATKQGHSRYDPLHDHWHNTHVFYTPYRRGL